MKTIAVDLSDLFDTEYPLVDVGDPKPGAKEYLELLKAEGYQVTIRGPILVTPFGTRAVMSRLYDLEMPFDELEQV